jgi:hypothetical protein
LSPNLHGGWLSLVFTSQEVTVFEPERHAEKRNFVESILRHIPGFRGYLEKEYRRDSDYLARKWLADRLQGSKRGLDDYFRGVLDAGQIDAMAQLDRIRTRLDAVIAKIRGDVRGYSGFFDYVRIDEGVLDKVYDHDMSLIADVDQFANTIEALGVQPGSLQDVSSDLLRRLDDVDRNYAKRDELLQGMTTK